MHTVKTILCLQEVIIKNPSLEEFIHMNLFMQHEVSGNIVMGLNSWFWGFRALG